MANELTTLRVRLAVAEHLAETAEQNLMAAFSRLVAHPHSQRAEIAYDGRWADWRSACDDLHAIRMEILRVNGGPGGWITPAAETGGR